MPIDIHFSESLTFHVEPHPRLVDWVASILKSHNKDFGDINIILQTDEELLELNKSSLNHDYYTDIITFNYNIENFISGDLYISLDRIKDNASNFAVTKDEELHRVIIHGILHLIGYNDQSEEDKREIRSKENEALEQLKLFHVKQ